jgi:nucleoside-diphosphate-sugar epimerase
VTSLIYPGRRGLSHAFAYLPDVGETIALLLQRDLAPFARFHFAGHQVTGEQLAEAVARAIGKAAVRVWRFPWFAVRLLSPFVTLFREMAEMRYLWTTPIALDDARLRAFLGASLPATPLTAAILQTLVGLGCLPRQAGERVRDAARSFPA